MKIFDGINTTHNLDIKLIKPYEDNRSLALNDGYDDLKDNIRVAALKQPLIITRRPGDDLYMLPFGGYTRANPQRAGPGNRRRVLRPGERDRLSLGFEIRSH